MTTPEQLEAQLESLAKSMRPTELNDLWVKFLEQKHIRTSLQKGLLAISLGFHQSGKLEGAKHFYDAAGYIEGLNAKIEEEEPDSSSKKEGR